jgi:hypothetical protein
MKYLGASWKTMLEIIGAGFGRTGTHSLALALDKLGFGPCYTIQEVANNHDHTQFWNNAMNGKKVDWYHLFSSYKSCVEWPSVFFFQELAYRFPQAKFILTLREPETWYESASKTIFEALELSAFNPDPKKRENSNMNRRLILECTFEGRHHDREFATEVYRKHIQRVIDFIPGERLLQFDVRDGWEPLCKFFQKPIPQEPFPWLNARSAFIASKPAWAKIAGKDNKENRTNN